MISGETPKVLVHTAHDVDGTPLVTTFVGGWGGVAAHVFLKIPTKWFDFYINPWGLVEAEIPIHHETLTELALENPRKMVIATLCNSAVKRGYKHVVFYNLNDELKNLDVFFGGLTEKDREVFDNCACNAKHYSKCVCLAMLVLGEVLNKSQDTSPKGED